MLRVRRVFVSVSELTCMQLCNDHKASDSAQPTLSSLEGGVLFRD